jgi:transcriptional regulator with XRE-family HTH domain
MASVLRWLAGSVCEVGWHVHEGDERHEELLEPPQRTAAELGRRLADHRAKRGWTQQQLADRLAISRVAVSHLESGMSPPAERTVALLAGLFKVEPHDLVAGTDYPDAKAERLPLVVARHTEVEHQLGVLEADLQWCEAVDDARTDHVLGEWEVRLRALGDGAWDPEERALVVEAAERVRRLVDQRVQRRS